MNQSAIKPGATGVQQWATQSINCCTGCSHGCLYCYAAADYCLRWRKRPRERWTEEKVNMKRVRQRHPKYAGRVMFPTTHDITLGNARACLMVIHQLLAGGNDVLVVSKMRPAIAAMLVDAIGRQWRDQLEFRISIGAVDDTVREFWEPGAPSIDERIISLRMLQEAGFRTSVAAEPLLQPWRVTELVATVSPHVTGTIWIGKLNQIKARAGWSGMLNDPRARALVEHQTDAKVMEVVETVKGNEKIRWKDSYRAVIDRCTKDDGE